jgi:peptidoglycan hydrolase CwlO-like protein
LATAAFVFVDSDGKLGTMPADGPDPGGLSPKPMQPSVPDAKQAMINRKVENLQATVSQQRKQIETLMTQLKEQAAQIQKVSAQLEIAKPATKVVVNKP